MAGLSIADPVVRAKLVRISDGLMVAVAVSLPWSTSATSILLVLWLLGCCPTLEWSIVRRELMTPAGGLPVLLFMLGVLGMAWADVTLLERWKGLDGFFKLLVIPLLMVHFRRSDNGMRVFIGFLFACVALLIASWIVTVWPDIPKGSIDPGVAVKAYIVQSAEFTMCAAGLLYLAVEAARGGRWSILTASLVLALAFLHDVFFIATSRTTLVVIPVLILIYGARQFGWKGFFGAAAAGLAIAAALWTTSPYLRDRAISVLTQTEKFAYENKTTSTGQRIVYWTKSLHIIENAPLIGHGTGSITEMFGRAALGHSGIWAEVPSNPHNQTFVVAIQLGLIGATALWAMWVSHFLLFRGAGLTAWLGLVVVTQNIVGSLFNSFLFDFTEGWLYVLGVGVAGGMVLRQFDAARAGRENPQNMILDDLAQRNANAP
ncbi:MAG: O-antigen ligase family protein [Pseudolabrys sp.]